MSLSARAHQLLQAFEQPGCPLCRLVAESVHAHLGSLVYEYANEPATHFAVRDARGFCAAHAWHALDQINASALGIALLYEGLVRNLLKDMGEIKAGSGRRQVAAASEALKPRASCPVCLHRATVEAHLLHSLFDHLDQAAFTEGFGASAGLCLPHLRAALDSRASAPAKARLLALQQAIWWRLQGELAEYIRKSDYQFAGEELGAEADSPRRAIASLSGARDLG
jgi:hypothetical protein